MTAIFPRRAIVRAAIIASVMSLFALPIAYMEEKVFSSHEALEHFSQRWGALLELGRMLFVLPPYWVEIHLHLYFYDYGFYNVAIQPDFPDEPASFFIRSSQHLASAIPFWFAVVFGISVVIKLTCNRFFSRRSH